MRLIAATGNRGKLRELVALLAALPIELVAQSDLDVPEAEETGLSFVENAIIKARNAAQHTGLPALGEDSGLEVDALAGAPGVFSARYAGDDASDADNNNRLLAELDGVTRRSARFRCVAVAMRHAADPAPLICSGTWEGRIGLEPAGGNGFGYDPLFRPNGLQCSSAELTAEQKNSISHRAAALAQLAARLQAHLEAT